MKKKVLIIEDEQSLQTVLSDRLQDEGFDIAVAIDGVEGMRKIDEWQPDVIILDMILPRQDGFTILETLRRKKVAAEPPILVLTNLADEANTQRMRASLVDKDRVLIKSATSMNTVIDALQAMVSED